MLPNGMTPDMDKKVVTWFNHSILMRQPELNQEDYNAVVDDFLFQMEDEYFEENNLDGFATDMKPAKYEKTYLEELASKQTHLSDEQQKDLLKLWRKHKNCLIAP